MKWPIAIALLVACTACSQRDAPADEVVKAAEELVEPSPGPSPLGRFAPQDTCAKVEGARQFRTSLAEVVKARDVDAFVAMSADDIILDSADGGGSAELRARLQDPSWALWDELDELMTLGCSANNQGGITIPWFFDQDLPGRDPTAAMLVTGESVPVLDGPNGTSRTIATVSWDLVKIATLDADEPYQQVELDDGELGFIETGKLRSVLDYRLSASSRNGRWRITSFRAGD